MIEYSANARDVVNPIERPRMHQLLGINEIHLGEVLVQHCFGESAELVQVVSEVLLAWGEKKNIFLPMNKVPFTGDCLSPRLLVRVVTLKEFPSPEMVQPQIDVVGPAEVLDLAQHGVWPYHKMVARGGYPKPEHSWETGSYLAHLDKVPLIVPVELNKVGESSKRSIDEGHESGVSTLVSWDLNQ